MHRSVHLLDQQRRECWASGGLESLSSIKPTLMWSAYRVPKTGQIIKKSSIYQMVVKNAMGLHCGARVDFTSLKMRGRQAEERRL